MVYKTPPRNIPKLQRQRLCQGILNNHKSFGYISRQIEDSMRKRGGVPSLALGGAGAAPQRVLVPPPWCRAL